MEFVVFGVPGPQGSKTMMQHRTTGRHIMLESSAKVKPWRAAVKAAAELAVLDRQVAGSGPWNPIGDPVMLRVVFTLERPKSHFRTGRNAHLLKESAPGYPVSHQSGDLSKLVRATEDAVTDAGVWVDDSLVAETMSTKVYIGDEHPRALAEQGAWIQITSMSGEPST
jgi:crossover junction endodeoxyribonuclease RusA